MVFLSTPLQIALAICLLYLFTAYLTIIFPTLSGKRILLLIAHPDDEAMFFGPTLRYLTHSSLSNQIIVLCFSSGNVDGLGHIRKSELQKSALQLGIISTEHVVVIEDKKFPVSMTANWIRKPLGRFYLGISRRKLPTRPV